jgi:excisionase family DNA binding protein
MRRYYEEAPEYLTVNEASDMLRLTERSIRRMILSGTIEAYKIGGRVRIERERLMASLKPMSVSKAS